MSHDIDTAGEKTYITSSATKSDNEAFGAGYTAFHENGCVDDCPHKEGSREHWYWMKGYKEAETDDIETDLAHEIADEAWLLLQSDSAH